MATRSVKKKVVDTEKVVEKTTAAFSEDKDVKEVVEKKVEPKKRVFDPEEGIPCKSIAYGMTFMEGKKSKELYEFQFEGDEVDVEYRDLAAAVRSNSGYLFTPVIVVQDEDFINEFPKLKEFYEENYCIDDPARLLDLDPVRFEEVLPKIPKGVADALKNIASKMISENRLDSVAKIRTLDQFFGTQLMLLTGLYD